MQDDKLFQAAFPFLEDVLGLPVKDIDKAAEWYGNAFGLTEVERRADPVPTVIMERDGVQVGFAVNGGVAENDGVAILVTDIHRAREELEANGVKTVNWSVEERRRTETASLLRGSAGRAVLSFPSTDRGLGFLTSISAGRSHRHSAENRILAATGIPRYDN